jgi:hypothetical protein
MFGFVGLAFHRNKHNDTHGREYWPSLRGHNHGGAHGNGNFLSMDENY